MLGILGWDSPTLKLYYLSLYLSLLTCKNYASREKCVSRAWWILILASSIRMITVIWPFLGQKPFTNFFQKSASSISHPNLQQVFPRCLRRNFEWCEACRPRCALAWRTVQAKFSANWKSRLLPDATPALVISCNSSLLLLLLLLRRNSGNDWQNKVAKWWI